MYSFLFILVRVMVDQEPILGALVLLDANQLHNLVSIWCSQFTSSTDTKEPGGNPVEKYRQ